MNGPAGRPSSAWWCAQCEVVIQMRDDSVPSSSVRSWAVSVSRAAMRSVRRCRQACWRCAFVFGIRAGHLSLRNECALTRLSLRNGRVAASAFGQHDRRPGGSRRHLVSRYRQGGSGREASGHGKCGPARCGRKGSVPSPAASGPLGRCKGQRGIGLGHGSPDGRRGLAVSLTEQLGCLCGGILGLAEVLFYVHWPSSRLVACYWSDTAHRRSANWSQVRNAEARPAGRLGHLWPARR
jgi:hypothetical protein